MKICEYCYQELLSRGEEVFARNTYDVGTCDFCGEKDELYETKESDDDD